MRTRIMKLEGRINRAPKGAPPDIHLDLEPGQYVTSVMLRECDPQTIDDLSRHTRDWEWTAYVVSPLGGV